MKKSILKYKKYILLIIAVCIPLVLIFTINTSKSKLIINEINKERTKEGVFRVWNNKIHEVTSKKGKEQVIKATKAKLANFELSDTEISNWHQKFREIGTDEQREINIIIVPDFSNRLTVIPNTPERDIEIISKIYEVFFDKMRKNKAVGKIAIEVTDKNQAGGIFSKMADSLVIDINDKNNEQNRKFILSKEGAFKTNIKKLYAYAIDNISGADYVLYFKRNINDRIKRSTIEREVINKIVILTDGYLETNETNYTKIHRTMKNAVDDGWIEDYLKRANLSIPSNNIDLSNSDILVLEVTERDEGIGWHKEILESYWREWFKSMNVRNINKKESFFISSENSPSQVKELVQKFIDK
ncbi:hypothetical protein [Bergeyella sp. RCAD1439]|uniref:hypothetical protein n=1 Tax=Bergeyella anatis TaxID=3113737 RepID=UPI002E173B74|nr:hypothetical protein [Bergeyella sp. RCAD1439]